MTQAPPSCRRPRSLTAFVFFGSYDGKFFAVNALKGTERWRMSTGPILPFPWGRESGDRYTSSPNVVSGAVLFGAGDGYVYSVDAATGRVRWRARTDGRVRGTPAVAEGTVFVGSFDGRVYAFDLATGKSRWRYDTEGAALNSGNYGFDRRSIQSSPAVSNGVVFIGARDGFVYALGTGDGKLRWRYNHEISWINSSPAVADGVVYDGSSDAHFVQALDAATGRELWRTDVGTTVWSSPSVAGDQLFFGDGSGRVRVVERRTGHELSTFTTGAGVFSSPVIAGDLLFVGGADGGVYALRLGGGPAIQRAVFLDSAYVRAEAAGRSVELTTYLTRRGYSAVDPKSIVTFLRARVADKSPSVIVFATDQVPPTLNATPARRSLLRQYLDAGGKVVWTGIPPMLWSLDSTGKSPSLGQYKWDAPSDLLGVSHAAAIFDAAVFALLKKAFAGACRAFGAHRGVWSPRASREHWASTTGAWPRLGSRATAALRARASCGPWATISSPFISPPSFVQRAEQRCRDRSRTPPTIGIRLARFEWLLVPRPHYDGGIQ